MIQHRQAVQDIRAISLDLDDTLWPIMPVIHSAERALQAWLREHQPAVATHYTPDTLERLRSEVLTDCADMHHDLTFIRCEVLARVGRLGGVGREFVDDAFAVFDRFRNQVELYPEAADVLDALGQKFPLIALTNGNARLEHIGLAHHFDAIITARETGVAKPHPDIFKAAALAVNTDPRHILHVGDHPEHDVHGAKQAGMKAVWINRDAHAWPDGFHMPDVEMRDLSGLIDLLDATKR
jgi:putative hydrolase of the HAD superfamily